MRKHREVLPTPCSTARTLRPCPASPPVKVCLTSSLPLRMRRSLSRQIMGISLSVDFKYGPHSPHQHERVMETECLIKVWWTPLLIKLPYRLKPHIELMMDVSGRKSNSVSNDFLFCKPLYGGYCCSHHESMAKGKSEHVSLPLIWHDKLANHRRQIMPAERWPPNNQCNETFS